VRTPFRHATLSVTAIGFATAGVLVAALFVFGRGRLSPTDAAIRTRSFVWPAAEVALGLVVVAVLAVSRTRPGRGAHAPRRRFGAGSCAAAVLLGCETAFLVTSGASLWSASPALAAPTPAETTLARTVGSALVGLGQSTCFTSAQLGMVPDANVALGIHEFAAYDPLLADAYSPSWPDEVGPTPSQHPPRTVPFSVFCPAVTTVRQARRYGIGFVLEPRGTPGPPGSRLVRAVDGEDLYRIPGAAAATVVPLMASGALPSLDASGAPVAVSHPDPATWRLVTHAQRPAVLRIRLTDVPGWRASIDGRPLALQRYGTVMLQARVPPGTHTVELTYLPAAFTLGVAMGVVAILGLTVVPLVLRMRRRGRRAGP
jgi:hypothetical protein